MTYACKGVYLDDVIFGDEKFIRLDVIPDYRIKTPAYLWYRFGFDEADVERTLAETAEHFYLSESRAKSTESTALNDVRQKLPW